MKLFIKALLIVITLVVFHINAQVYDSIVSNSNIIRVLDRDEAKQFWENQKIDENISLPNKKNVFSALNWGSVISDTIQVFIDNLTNIDLNKRKGYFGLYFLGTNISGKKEMIRPLVEFLYDPQNSFRDRIEVFRLLSKIGAQDVLKVLTEKMETSHFRLNNILISSLYYSGAKELAFTKMVDLIKKNDELVLFYPQSQNAEPLRDVVAIPFFKKMLTFHNSPSIQILATYYLASINEKTVAKESLMRLEKRLKLGKIIIPKGRSHFGDYLRLTQELCNE